MKTKIIALLVLTTVVVTAQMNNWVMPPQKVAMNLAATPISQPLYPGAASTGSYGLSNGVYDDAGALLFYVKDEYVYDQNGVSVGHIGYNETNLSIVNESFHSGLGGEIAIVPIPGQCKKFYVIFSRGSQLNRSSYMYITVDCSGTNPVIVYADGAVRNHTAVGNYRLARGLGIGEANNTGLAVSKMLGSGSSAIFHLYACTPNGIYYHTISSGGISNGASIGPIGLPDYLTNELELSPDGLWMAWAHQGNVRVIGLNSLGTSYNPSTLKTYSYTSGDINGIEFVGEGGQSYLYVAGYKTGSPVTPIFDRIGYLATPSPTTSISLGTANLNNSFLEFSRNGRLYGIYDDAGILYLLGYQPSSGAISASPIGVSSNHSNLPSSKIVFPLRDIYTLPDQIDGGDYNNFSSTFPLVTLNQISINSSAFQNNCTGTFIQAYNCAPITINASYNGGGTPCRYEIKIDPVDQNCNLLPHAGNYSYGYGPMIATDALNGLDIRGLYTDYQNSLNTKPGYYKVNATIYDCCGKASSQTAYIRVLQAIPPTLNLEVYDTYFDQSANPPVAYLPATQTIASAILTGALSAQFRINNSSGAATSYNITIDQVNNSGIFVKNIYNKTVPVSNIAGVAAQSLNSLCYPASAWAPTVPGGGNCSSASPAYTGYTGYFGYMNGTLTFNNYYKLTVTLNNECSSTSNYSYLFVNNGYQRPTLLTETTHENMDIIVYPNPASDKVTIKINSGNGGKHGIKVHDLSGRLVKDIAEDFDQNVGVQTMDIDVKDLQDGMYIYKIGSGANLKTGIINIIH